VAFAAGLRVVERSEAVRNLLYGIKFRHIRLMRSLVHETITPVVKPGRCVHSGRRWSWDWSGGHCDG
jgi:hypothetical protein